MHIADVKQVLLKIAKEGSLGSEWFLGLMLRMVLFGRLEPGLSDYTLISLRSGSSRNNRIKKPLAFVYKTLDL